MRLPQNKLGTRKKWRVRSRLNFISSITELTRPWRQTLITGSGVKCVFPRCRSGMTSIDVFLPQGTEAKQRTEVAAGRVGRKLRKNGEGTGSTNNPGHYYMGHVPYYAVSTGQCSWQSYPTLHRLQNYAEKAKCPTHFDQDCSSWSSLYCFCIRARLYLTICYVSL